MENELDFEIEYTKSNFHLEQFLNFTLEHDVQIIRGGDYQYGCYIDNICYGNYITTFGALSFGINSYKLLNK